MRSMRFVLATAATLALFAPGAGHADPYKWCAQYGLSTDLGTNCGFVTYEQCRAAVSGAGGTCQPNQFYDGKPFGSDSEPQRAPRKRKHRQD
ncbi:MAG TPA: DUF3551 domain-containing protein [Pseudolabrys sp.]|nr:DUF3551 domain-containing protein [Pseudolabrys sp.]